MSLSTNTTYRLLVEKLGASDPGAFVGNAGEVFYDPSVASLKLSDGSTSGGTTIGGGGGASYWVSTTAGIHTLSNVGVGTTNPRTRLQVGSVFDPQVIGFGTAPGVSFPVTNVLIGDEATGSSLQPSGSWNGMNNAFIGAGAGKLTTTGWGNNFFGLNAGRSNTTGYYNNFFGVYAGQSNTTGSYNNFFGSYSCGTNNTTGSHNNFFGGYAGTYNTSGNYNNFFGNVAGEKNTTGTNNNFIGAVAGFRNTTGSYNNFFGRRAGERNETGNNNSCIGHEGGKINKFGSNSLYYGNFTGVTTSGNYKVVIGNGFSATRRFDVPKDATDIGTPAGSDIQLAIGVRTDNNPANYWIVGDQNYNIGIGTTNPTKKLDVLGDVRVGINTSQGVVLTSPNGTQYRLVVDDAGNLSTSAV